ncbi:MAG: ankyrin repeat domain-containing protein [Verrucomicrobiota bacterium]
MNPVVRRFVFCLSWSVLLVACSQTQAPSISLQKAVEQADLKAVQQHIAAKSDLNKADNIGLTPLHWAAVKGNLPIVQALTAAGADVNRRANNGKTALDMAREKGQVAVAEFLQKRGEPRGRGLIDGGLGVSEALDAQ